MRRSMATVVALGVAVLILSTSDQAAAQRFPRVARALDRLRTPPRVAPPGAIIVYSPSGQAYEVYPPYRVYYRFGTLVQTEVPPSSTNQTRPAPAEVAAAPQASTPANDPDLDSFETLPSPPPQLPQGSPGAPIPADPLTQATQDLRAARYEPALRALHEVLSREPRNTRAMLLAAHALFGLGEFPQSAETLRSAIATAPATEWGEVVQNYRGYFASAVEYSDRLRALETYVAQHPDSAGARLLLGYHYGYLGLRADAMAQIDQALTVAPNDPLGLALANQFEQRKAPVAIQPAAAAAPVEERAPSPAVEGPLLFRPKD